MGIISSPEPSKMTQFTKRLFEKFRSKIKEVKDLKRIINIIKHEKKVILTNIMEERDFVVNRKLYSS